MVNVLKESNGARAYIESAGIQPHPLCVHYFLLCRDCSLRCSHDFARVTKWGTGCEPGGWMVSATLVRLATDQEFRGLSFNETTETLKVFVGRTSLSGRSRLVGDVAISTRWNRPLSSCTSIASVPAACGFI